MLGVSVEQERSQHPVLPIPPLLPTHDRAPRSVMAVPNTPPTSVPSARVWIYFPSAPSVALELPCRHRSVRCPMSSLPVFSSSEKLSPLLKWRPCLAKQGGIYT